jgi:septum formation protein
MLPLILASLSPRRKEILSAFNLPFMQCAPDFDEEEEAFEKDPQEYVMRLAAGKANSLAPHYPASVILAADTTVYAQEVIYNKPKDEREAFFALSALVGKWHSVFTGVAVQCGGKKFQQVEETRVLFNDLTEEQIKHYLLRTEWSDKAGGYAIQLGGGLIVKRIEGCYYNVLGLPINTVRQLLLHFQIDLWDYL